MIGAIGLQLIKGCLDGIKHRGVTLTYNNALRASTDHGTSNGKLAWIQLVVVVSDRGVLVGRNYAMVCQQLYYSGLILQDSHVNSRLTCFYAGVTGGLQVILLYRPCLHPHILAAQVSRAL